MGALPVLRELYASFNEVEDCSPLAQCELLETVDLEANRLATLEVRSPSALQGVSPNPELRHLTLP